MNMAKTRKAAKKKNTPTTLANESTPRLKKTKKKSLKWGGKIGKTKTANKFPLKWDGKFVNTKKAPRKIVKMMREIRQNKNAKKPIKHEHTWSRGNCPRLKDIQTATISFEVPQVPKICDITNMNSRLPLICVFWKKNYK